MGRVKAAEHADGGNPSVHVLLGLSHQVPGAFLRLQVKNEAALQLLLRERESSIHLSESTTENNTCSVCLFNGPALNVPAHTGSG